MKIPTETYERIKFAILNKLQHKEMWENVYMPVEKVVRVVQGHDRGFAKEIIASLAKETFLLNHKNNSCVSLNRVKKPDIEKFLSENHNKYS